MLAPSLAKFFQAQATESKDRLLQAVRQHVRDTMREARIAGEVEAYESILGELQRFAEKQLREASQ